MRPLPVRLDVPDAFRARAWYALEELLRGMGLVPVEAGAATPALVYGPKATPGVAFVPYDARTPALLEDQPKHWQQGGVWLAHEGSRVPVLFGTAGAPDLIASAFLWLSGWSEQARAEADRHGRLPFAASLAGTLGVATTPPVDVYRAMLADRLAEAGVAVERAAVAGAPWAVCVTCDVDHVRYGKLRRAARALAGGQAGEAARALGAWLRPDADPYRAALAYLADTTAAHGGRATILFKAGATDPHDVPYRLDAPWLRALTARLVSEGHELGLHPGYDTPLRADLLAAEVRAFADVFGAPPVSVRQHYLRHAGAVTARQHVEAGLRVDNTLGWTEAAGFRNGTTHPFRAYDPIADAPLPLTEVPLAWMDAGAFGTRTLGLDAAWTETLPLLEAARRHGGVFAGLWHNTFLGPSAPAAQHLVRTLNYAVAHGAAIIPLRSFAA